LNSFNQHFRKDWEQIGRVSINSISGLLGMALLLVPVAALPANGECSIASGEHTVTLLELFTSEGCSSCPPADRWLSGLRSSSSNSGRVVPLALHVDYWDSIGWKDAFAKPDFALRQRKLAERGRQSMVYTPQVFVQGAAYDHPVDTTAFNALLESTYRQAPKADLVLSLGAVSEGKLAVKVTAELRNSAAHTAAGLYIALYENDLVTQVKAGENRGSTLRHDFVVREWIGPSRLTDKGRTEVAVLVPTPPGGTIGNFGVAVFVQDLRTQEVLQALARPLCL
jgi:hypothetical protein